MDFVTKSFRKDETLSSWTLLQHICSRFWAWLPNIIAITPKNEDKYVLKVVNWSEFHFSEMTCYKIHTLVKISSCTKVFNWSEVTPCENFLPDFCTSAFLKALKINLFKKEKKMQKFSVCTAKWASIINLSPTYCKSLISDVPTVFPKISIFPWRIIPPWIVFPKYIKYL